jgi:prephenate dehydrogenase
MNKVAIIGLGLVGNSIGMGLKKHLAPQQPLQVVGFDPDRSREEAALRKHASVDSIAPDLESAVTGAQLVIIATPASAAREVLEAVARFVEEGAIVTDTLSTKSAVMDWANELLGERASFVGGHPLSKSIDLETVNELEPPRADLFNKALYCIMPAPRASGEALNTVIGIAETLGAHPLFIDPYEHDSYFAAASHLPVLASAALLRVTSSSPSWDDIRSLARGQFGSVAQPLSTGAQELGEALMSNRQVILHWLDQYQLALQDLRDMLAAGDEEGLLSSLESAHDAHDKYAHPREAPDLSGPYAARRQEENARLREDLQQAIDDTRPISSNRLLGKYLSDRMFGKKDK